MNEALPDADRSRHETAPVRSNYGFLCVALSLNLLVGPALGHSLLSVSSPAVSALFLCATILIGIWSFVGSRRTFWLGLGLAGLVVIASFTKLGLEFVSMRLTILSAFTLFLLVSIWHAGRDVLFGGPVTFNRLLGAMCIYEIFGLIWAMLYSVVAVLSPDSFDGAVSGGQAAVWDFVYFSFVTLTTLGYGDMTPLGPFAKSLAYMEALIGQIYIAVLVATLVGAHLLERLHR